MKFNSLRSYRLYILFLGSVAAIPAIATDMYLAAIPRISEQWGVPEGQVNLSLVLWFVFFSISLLVCGTLSDRWGRRPVLLWGLGLFILSSFLCALTENVTQLILCRILQGIAAAAPTSMSMAICRDRFEGAERYRAIAYMVVILGLAPMLAPMIGSALLALGNWRLIFVLQGILSLITGIIAWLIFDETAHKLNQDSFLLVFQRYLFLFRNKNYMSTTMIMGISAGPMLGFVAFSPILYLSIFKLNNAQFSLLFGINAAMLMAGSYSGTILSRWMSLSKQFYAGFSGCVIAGVLILRVGALHPLAFSLPMFLFSFCCNICRPAGNNLILSQVTEDIGTASSFMIFYQSIFNSICMAFCSYGWAAPIQAFGWLMLIISVVVLVSWPLLKRRLVIV